MKVKEIHKTIDINAPKERVWEVLFDDKYYRIWAGEFMEGSYAETDWKEGGKAAFKGPSGDGLFAKINRNTPYEYLEIEFLGNIIGNVEDTESEGAKAFKGIKETYTLTEGDGRTHLEIKSGMIEQYYDQMIEDWDKALAKLKELAEEE